MPVKILILGGGQVGSSVVENLCGDANDITVVDLDADLLKALQDRYDIQTIAGNAAHPSVLEAAGADDTDMLLALTRDDETNLMPASSPVRCSTFRPRSPASALPTMSSTRTAACWNSSPSIPASAPSRS